MTATRAQIGERKRARTRTELIEAAMRLIARLGADAPTIDAVIAEAGMARGTFYNYFATRDDLLAAVAGEVSERLIAGFAEQRRLPDPADRVGRAVRRFIRLAAADPTAGWTIVRIGLLAAPLGASMRANIATDIAEGLSSGRFRAPSPQAAADLMLGLGLMGMRSVLRGDAPECHAEHMAELVLRALGVPDAAEVANRPLADANADQSGR